MITLLSIIAYFLTPAYAKDKKWALEIEYSNPQLREGRDWTDRSNLLKRGPIESVWMEKFGWAIFEKLNAKGYRTTPVMGGGDGNIMIWDPPYGVDNFHISGDPGVVELKYGERTLRDHLKLIPLFNDFINPAAEKVGLSLYGSTHFNLDIITSFGEYGGLDLARFFLEFSQRPEISFGIFGMDLRNAAPLLSIPGSDRDLIEFQNLALEFEDLINRGGSFMNQHSYDYFKERGESLLSDEAQGHAVKSWTFNSTFSFAALIERYALKMKSRFVEQELDVENGTHYQPFNFRTHEHSNGISDLFRGGDFISLEDGMKNPLLRYFPVNILDKPHLEKYKAQFRAEFRPFRTFEKFEYNTLMMEWMEAMIDYSIKQPLDKQYFFQHFDLPTSQSRPFSSQELVDLFYIHCFEFGVDFERFRPLLMPELRSIQPSAAVRKFDFNDIYWDLHRSVGARLPYYSKTKEMLDTYPQKEQIVPARLHFCEQIVETAKNLPELVTRR